jgi:hypothetical protein
MGSAGHFLAHFSAPCMRCCVAQSVSRHARPLPRRVARGFTSRRSLVAWMRRRFWWRRERIGREKIWCGFVFGERCPHNTTCTVDGMKDMLTRGACALCHFLGVADSRACGAAVPQGRLRSLSQTRVLCAPGVARTPLVRFPFAVHAGVAMAMHCGVLLVARLVQHKRFGAHKVNPFDSSPNRALAVAGKQRPIGDNSCEPYWSACSHHVLVVSDQQIGMGADVRQPMYRYSATACCTAYGSEIQQFYFYWTSLGL